VTSDPVDETPKITGRKEQQGNFFHEYFIYNSNLFFQSFYRVLNTVPTNRIDATIIARKWQDDLPRDSTVQNDKNDSLFL
jgi:hypothetical protein